MDGVCLQAKAAATKEDLMTRLSNAVKQRDAAREEALLAAEKLNKLQEDLDAGRLQPAAEPAAPAAPAPALSTPGVSTPASAFTPPGYAGGAGEPGELQRAIFLKFASLYEVSCYVRPPSPSCTVHLWRCQQCDLCANGFTSAHGRRNAGASAEVYGHARLAWPPAWHARDQRRHARPHHADAAQHGRASGPQVFWCGLQPPY